MLSLVGYDLKSNFGEGVRVNEVIQLSIHSSVLVKDVEAEKVYLQLLKLYYYGTVASRYYR